MNNTKEQLASNAFSRLLTPRRLRFAAAAITTLALMPLVIPTMQAALGQDCNINNTTFTVRTTKGQDNNATLANGASLTLVSTFQGVLTPATFTVISGPGMGMVAGGNPAGARFTVKRNNTSTDTGPIQVRATYTNGGNTYVIVFTIN